MKNESNEYASNHWRDIFASGGNGGINEEMLNSLTIDDLKNIVKGWNEANPDSIIQYYHAGDGNRGRGVFVGKGEMIRRMIEEISKKTAVLSAKEIAALNKILYDGINEVKTRERDIKV